MNAYLVKCLKEGRAKKGLKQSDVTDLIGIKNTTLSNYENGVSEPDIDTFLQLCQLYEIDYVKVLETAYGKRTQEMITKEQQDLLNKYSLIDPLGKKAVTSVLDVEYERVQSVQDDYRMPQAAHNDKAEDPEEQELTKKDLERMK